MRTIKTTTISILALGLLAGSAVGVAAQDEEEAAVVSSFTAVDSPDAEGSTRTRRGRPPPDGLEETTGSASGEPGIERRAHGGRRHVGRPLDDRSRRDVDERLTLNVLVASTWELTNDGGSWLVEATSFSNTELGVNAG